MAWHEGLDLLGYDIVTEDAKPILPGSRVRRDPSEEPSVVATVEVIEGEVVIKTESDEVWRPDSEFSDGLTIVAVEVIE